MTCRITRWVEMPRPEDEYRELTAGQAAIRYAQPLISDESAYHTGDYVAIHGVLDPDLFVEALRRTWREAETLRVRFHEFDGVARQFVDESMDFPIHYVDVSSQ